MSRELKTTDTTLSRIRYYAFVLVILAILAMGIVFTGELLLLLGLGWTASVGVELGIHRLHVMAIAASVGVFLVAMAVQLYKPRQRRAVMLAGAGFIALIGVFTVVSTPDVFFQEVAPFFVLGLLAALIHPSGRKLLRLGEEYSPLLLGLTVAAALPLVAFAVDQFALQATGDAHAVDGHYAVMAALSLGVVLMGAIASARTPGWRIVAWLTGVLVAYVGVLSVAFPGQASSVGAMWGAAAVVWAVGFVAAAEYSRVAAASSLFHRPRSFGRRSA